MSHSVFIQDGAGDRRVGILSLADSDSLDA